MTVTISPNVRLDNKRKLHELSLANGEEMVGRMHRNLAAPLALMLLVIATAFSPAEESLQCESASGKQPTADRTATGIDRKRILPRSKKNKFMPTNATQYDAEAMEKAYCRSNMTATQKQISAAGNRLVGEREEAENALIRQKNSHHDRLIRVLGKKLCAEFLKLNLQDPDEINAEDEIRKALERLSVEAKPKNEAADKANDAVVAVVE